MLMIDWREDASKRFENRDIRKSRVSAAFAYIFFFVPLVMCPDLRFARYHANQGLILLVWMTIGTTLLGMVPYIGVFLLLAALLFGVFCMVRGIILSLRGVAKGIPLLGNFVLIEFEPRA